jgi:hypothetical protein
MGRPCGTVMEVSMEAPSVITSRPLMVPEAAFAEEAAPVASAGYLDHGGVQLYYVLHSAGKRCRGQVLLAGPFASERNSSYIPWVRWARFLALQGYEVMRIDYRGMGESTGAFENMNCSCWQEDIGFAARWLASRGAGCPLVIHGLELGGLLAARVFAQGLGNALLVWSPPRSARELMLEGLRQKLFIDYTSGSGKRLAREEFIRELEAGRPVEVGGFRWSPALWKDAANFCLEMHPEQTMLAGRPSRLVNLDPSTEPLVSGPNKWRLLNPPTDERPLPLNPDLRPCFEENVAWLNEVLGLS